MPLKYRTYLLLSFVDMWKLGEIMNFFPSRFMTNDTACREHPLEEDRLLTTNAARVLLAKGNIEKRYF